MGDDQHQLYQDLIEQSPDPIITLDQAGIIRFFNSAAEEASLYSAAELVNTHFTRTGVLTAAGVVKAVQEFVLVVAGQTRPPFELEVVRKDRTMLTFEAHPKRITLSGGALTIQVVFRDVTKRKELEDMLRKKNAALEQLTHVMASRDTRILELEREVNALLTTLQQPPKYQA